MGSVGYSNILKIIIIIIFTNNLSPLQYFENICDMMIICQIGIFKMCEIFFLGQK